MSSKIIKSEIENSKDLMFKNLSFLALQELLYKRFFAE